MILVMVKEADLNRIGVPGDYEVLDATALGRRLGFKRDTVLKWKKRRFPYWGTASIFCASRRGVGHHRGPTSILPAIPKRGCAIERELIESASVRRCAEEAACRVNLEVEDRRVR